MERRLADPFIRGIEESVIIAVAMKKEEK